MVKGQRDNLLKLPDGAGRLIFETDSFMTVHLLNTRNFLSYCDDRDLRLNEERLLHLERLGLFRPIARFKYLDAMTEKLCAPNGPAAEWFEKGFLIDTYHPGASYDLPTASDEENEAYFSIFQIEHLSFVLTEFSLNVHLDAFVGEDAVDWNKLAANWMARAAQGVENWQTHEFRRAIPILCQYVANRYYPKTQTNQRVFTISSGGYSEDPWMFINGHEWDWHKYARRFDPNEVEARFSLTPDILRHAYEAIGGSASCDPLDRWANLVEFVSLHQKKKLKGKALRALAYRDAANMLRMLFKDLYGAELRPTHQIFGKVMKHFPELEVRQDIRRHLEFVVNQYDLNPQPKLVLFVEGESEIVLIEAIFDSLFGIHPGVSGIEIVNLRGVNNATGSRKADRFQAIFRLIDYLHHHQTLTFLILDRENQAETLKAAARKAQSIHGQKRKTVPEDHINLWKISLEFDNFSDTEIARAMTLLAEGHANFKSADVRAARKAPAPGNALSKTYKEKTGYGLNKPKLAAHLAAILADPKSRRHPKNRPMVAILDRARRLAARNPFPTRQDSWVVNQGSAILGGDKKLPKK